MRLLLAHPFTSWNGVRRGGERYLDDLLAHGVAAGHEVTVATAGPAGAYDRTGARVVELPVPPGPGSAEAFGAAVGELVRAGAYDVVHALEVPAALGAAGAGCPTVLSVLGLPHADWLATVPSYARQLREAGERVDVLCALSGPAARALEEAVARPVTVLPPGVRLEDFPLSTAPRDGRTVLFAGAVEEPRKRLDALVAALEDVPQARLVTAAFGDPAPLLAAHPGVAARTQVLHVRDSARLAELYAGAAVVAVPSVDEAFGLVVVEALATGTPVLVAPGSGPQEIVGDAPVGVVTDDLAAGLRALLAQPRDPQACRDRAAVFAWSRVGPQHQAVWERARDRTRAHR